MQEIHGEDICNDTYGRRRMYQALLLKQPDPSLITLTWWEGFCAGMIGLAKQLGWEDT